MSWSGAYKIIVVEDEPPILNNIVHKIEALELPLRVAGTAMDGESALALIERVQPHIVLTDIRMPGMDGLELCRRISEDYPEIKAVVLTGYSEFEYARTAIRYQVAEYLLKPVNAAKLHETLETLCKELEETLRAARRQHLERQLSVGTEGQELPFRFEGDSFDLCLVCLGNLLDNDDGLSDAKRSGDLWQRAKLDEFLGTQNLACWWLIDEKNPNERMLLTVGGAPELSQQLFRHLREQGEGAICVNLCRCDGPVDFSQIWNTARQLRAALRRCLVPCHSGIFAPVERGWSESAGNAWLSLTQAVRGGSPTQFRGTLHTFLTELREKRAPQTKLEAAVKDLLHAILERRQEGSGAGGSWHQLCEQIILRTESGDALYAQLEEQLCAAFAENAASALSAEQLAHSVKKYLEENYRQEVTMEDLTRRFHFSGSYITRLFRNQYGTPPVKYLLSLRIRKAKELISSTPEISFGTVAQLVGYEDQHYFSRLFRISTGMSPSEYKDSLK